MLQLTIPPAEFWDEKKEEFVCTKGATLQLEHSLISLSKWESKWCKSFLSPKNQAERTPEEFIDYVRCMTLTQNVDPEVYAHLTRANLDTIHKYINAPMTATHFSSNPSTGSPSRDVKTAEVIYWEMIGLGIPFECQKWHLNRLFTLIEVCVRKSGTRKPMNKRDIMRRNSRLNAARRKKYNTRG